MASRELVFAFLGKDVSAGRTMNKLGAELEVLGAKSHATGGMLGKLGGVFAGVGASAAVAAGVTVKMAGDFQSSMAKIHTTAGVPQAAIKGLGDGVLKLAGQVGTGPQSLAAALYHIESSFASTGLSASKAMELLKISAEGAKIGNSDLVDTTNALDAAVVSGIKGVQSYSQAMGALNAAVGSGDMKMQDMADALGTGVLAVVKNFGVTLRDSGAALATFGDNNIRGAEAGTQLRMAIMSLTHPTKEGGKVLGAMGVSAQGLTKDMQQGGLLQALTDLHDHMNKAGKTGDKVGSTLADAFGKKAGTGLSILLGQFDRFTSKYGEIDKQSAKFGDAWTATTKTFSFQLSAAEDSAKALGVRIGTVLLPAATSLLSLAAKGGNALAHMFEGPAKAPTQRGGVADRGGRDAVAVAPPTGLQAFGQKARNEFAKIRDVVAGVMPKVEAFAKTIGTDLWKSVKNLISAFAPAAKAIAPFVVALVAIGGAAVLGALKGVGAVLVAVTGFLAHHKTVVGAVVTTIGAFWAITKVVTIATRLWAAAQAVAIVATGGLTGVMTALSVAMDANPIGVVVIALAALAAGLGYAYKHSETFRSIVQRAFKIVKTVALDVFSFFKRNWPLLLPILTGPMGAAVAFIIKHWQQVKAVTSAVWRAVSAAVSFFAEAIKNTVASRLSAIRATWTTEWHIVRSITSAVWNAIRGTVTSVFNATKNVISSVFRVIRGLWSSSWNAVAGVATSIWGRIKSGVRSGLNGVKSIFSSMVHAIGKVWSGIEGVVKAPLKSLFGFINRDIIANVNKVTSAFGVKINLIPGFSQGGVHGVRPGYTPGRDTHLIAVGGGEAIMRPEWTRAVGPKFVDNANRAARSGGVAGVHRFMAGGGQAFAHGGVVGSIKHAAGNVAHAAGNVAHAASVVVGDVGSVVGKIGDLITRGAGYAVSHVLGPAISALSSRFKTPDIPDKLVVGVMRKFATAAESWGKQTDAASAAGGGSSSGIMNWPKVQAWAMGHLGIPYQLGGNGPRYDCSSFTQSAEAAGGVRIPRTAAAQQASAHGISKAGLIAGDLGFVGRPAHHVGLYMGNGRWAAEHHTGTVSSITSGDGWDSYGRVGTIGGSGGGGNFAGGGSSAAARAWASQALAILGLPQSWIAGIVHQGRTESGWNPNAVQKIHDVNSGGNEARGWLQVIPPTFARWALPGHGNIFNPIDNAIASIRYADARYGAGWFADGSWHNHGYEQGTPFVPQTGPALLHKGEAVIPAAYNPFSKPPTTVSSDLWLARIYKAVVAVNTSVIALRPLMRSLSGGGVSSSGVVGGGSDGGGTAALSSAALKSSVAAKAIASGLVSRGQVSAKTWDKLWVGNDKHDWYATGGNRSRLYEVTGRTQSVQKDWVSDYTWMRLWKDGWYFKTGDSRHLFRPDAKIKSFTKGQISSAAWDRFRKSGWTEGFNDSSTWLTLSAPYKKAAAPRYAQGTAYVPSDGPAFLHRGEAVIPAEYNKATRRAAPPMVVNITVQGSVIRERDLAITVRDAINKEMGRQGRQGIGHARV